ncbi:unnamed protein product, partial [Acidithrix sp. C25]
VRYSIKFPGVHQIAFENYRSLQKEDPSISLGIENGSSKLTTKIEIDRVC